LKIGVEEWMACSICGARFKVKNMPEHKSKVHPKSHL
jgi:hypothetical protein